MNSVFGFPQADKNEKQQFKRNILQSVTFLVGFNAKEVDMILLKDTLLDEFGESWPKVQEIVRASIKNPIHSTKAEKQPNIKQEVHGYSFQNKEGTLELRIQKEQISLSVKGSDYQNFGHFARVYKEFFDKAIKILGIEEFNRISLRKINMASFAMNISGVAPINSLTNGLNIVLLTSLLTLPQKELLTNFISDLSFSNNNHHMKLSYGMINKKMTSSDLLLDIDAMYLAKGIRIEDFFQEMKNLNDEIYNVFIWSIGADLKQFLTQD